MSNQTISSPHNPRIKSAVKLRGRRTRRKLNHSIIDGRHEIARAFAAGATLYEVFFCESLVSDEGFRLLRQLEQAGISTFAVTAAIFQRIAYGDRCDGMVSTVETPTNRLHEIKLSKRPLVILMDRVQKPGNLGAVLRSADGVGADCVVVVDGETDIYNPNAIRASLGAVFTLPVCDASMDEAYDWLRQHKVQMLATRVDGATRYTSVDFRQPSALILGSEADGLENRWTQSDVESVSIPMFGITDSLNVSVASAILMYEAIRQRTA